MQEMPNHAISAITAEIAEYIAAHQLVPAQGELIVAVSGGADSLSLLHILQQLCGEGKRYPKIQLHVAHLDHQLRPEVSRQEARMVEQLVTTWGLPITIGTVDVPALARRERRSLEDAARIARYRFLREVAHGQPIAVAHHQDDQVETLLLHWLRGGGIQSMVGLQPRQQDIVRPLLCISHEDTLAYCRTYHLTPLEDASNRDPRFLRNRIRHELLPLLTSMNPNIRGTLLRNAEVLSVDARWLEQQVTEYWPTVVTMETEQEYTLNITALLALPLSLQRHMLRRCSGNLCAGQSPLELRHYLLLEQFLRDEPTGEERVLHLPEGLRVTRVHNTLTMRRVGTDVSRPGLHTDRVSQDAIHRSLQLTQRRSWLPIPGSVEIEGTPWTAQAEFVPEQLAVLVRAALQSNDFAEVWRLLPVTRYAVYIDADTVAEVLSLRTREPGDRIHPLGMAHEKKVQDVLIDAHIPRAERAQLPLFFSGTQSVWLAGVCLDEHVRLTRETRHILRLSLRQTQHNE